MIDSVNAALLVVSGKEKVKFIDYFYDLSILFTFGIKKLIIAVNKMENQSFERFSEIK